MKLFEMLQGKFKGMAPKEAYDYTKVHGPIPELEDIIASDAKWSYWYAKNVLHNKFSAGEIKIARSARWSYFYAYNILDGRFAKGENEILRDPFFTFMYAKYILGYRWLKAEPSIRKSNRYWSEYKKCFNIRAVDIGTNI